MILTVYETTRVPTDVRLQPQRNVGAGLLQAVGGIYVAILTVTDLKGSRQSSSLSYFTKSLSFSLFVCSISADTSLTFPSLFNPTMSSSMSDSRMHECFSCDVDFLNPVSAQHSSTLSRQMVYYSWQEQDQDQIGVHGVLLMFGGRLCTLSCSLKLPLTLLCVHRLMGTDSTDLWRPKILLLGPWCLEVVCFIARGD